ncbi:MAG: UpxY family transcription antiterminator [Bacteroidales bacterium]|nr:UpxY family transcription antiterminator [Bacteroidales bacterium]
MEATSKEQLIKSIQKDTDNQQEVKYERKWYAIYTKSRCEKKIYTHLTDLGYTAYVPMRKELHKWSDRKKLIEVPMINSYCFVYLDANRERQKVFEAPGYVGFVSKDRHPVVIPEAEIEAMKKTVDSMLSVEIESRLLRKGKRVRILTGPMTGAIGVVENLTSKKVNILLTAIGVTMIVDLNDNVHFETVEDIED